MAFSTGLNPDVVKTSLDDVFYQAYEKEGLPYRANAGDVDVFKQDTLDNAADIQEIMGGVSFWDERAELEDVASDARSSQKLTPPIIS